MTEPLSHEVGKNEEKTDFHVFLFYDKDGDFMGNQKLCFTYTDTFPGVIENVTCELPTEFIMTEADNFDYDIHEQIENVTGKSIYGEITYL